MGAIASTASTSTTDRKTSCAACRSASGTADQREVCRQNSRHQGTFEEHCRAIENTPNRWAAPGRLSLVARRHGGSTAASAARDCDAPSRTVVGVLSPTLATWRLAIHVLAAAVGVGGQFVLGALVPSLRKVAPDTTPVVARAFARIAWPAFGVLVLTGIWNLSETRSATDRRATRSRCSSRSPSPQSAAPRPRCTRSAAAVLPSPRAARSPPWARSVRCSSACCC